MILHYFKKKENTQKIIVENLYKNILLESNLFLNQNSFFKEKNYKTSFEIVSMLIILHIKKNIKYKIKNYKLINEEIINIFILDLDESLRAKGIGDMSIGKYVKSYVKKFYFRLANFPGNIDKIKIEEFSKYLKLFDFIIENKEIEASKEFLIFLDKTSAHIK
tara:strand:- start:319 stop:807 length:489 start_codon:yes stop_codon:yes gene_type:complete